MPREAAGKLSVLLDVIERSTGLALGAASQVPHVISYEKTLDNGTADGQIDRVHSVALSLSGAATDYDLAGVLTSQLAGTVTTFVELTTVMICNDSAVGDIIVGGDVNFAGGAAMFGAAAHTIAVKPGGCFVWHAPNGIAITPGTGDILQLAASAGTVVGRMTLAGRSA